MRVCIFKYVFFSIIICFFEYAKNELYLVNERSVYLERNVINFRNNRILANAENQFNLNDFYQSTLSLVNQFNDNDELIYIRNTINSQIRKHKKKNTLPNLNNVDKKTKKLIDELQKELEVKKELGNKRDYKLIIQPIYDKRIIKKDENNSVSEHENFRELENYENNLGSENYNFDSEYIDVTLSNDYKKLKIKRKLKKKNISLLKKFAIFMLSHIVVVASGGGYLILLAIPCTISLFKKCWEILKLAIKQSKLSK
ncbi:fam-b protein [Plasmodium yoelii]|uniref:Fam-b protein n=3 Tax=Plasmodium yoelii TaxID=5861 RepID=Q7RJ34_PLAYO|nr:fam-b protein [Plasmodium yoelii]EAA22999.1 hypothetical protein [Plasmodium yoelii yoelii]WBY54416.1 fam-b protein [Plasmodium yoelii yoelii]CDU15840.1 fam-b protein [Plasmodium yoelii]VTZ71435.1 fam-b protein [Plasmodium yoelii]|eukprot:XP_034493330.1 fam-b protein [Plasmodium yoelii]